MKFMHTISFILSLLFAILSASPVPPNSTDALTLIEAGALGERHDGIRFSAATDYPNAHFDTYGACSSAGADEQYHIKDPSSLMVSLDVNVPDWKSYCGKRVRLYNPDGRTVEATIVDACPGCGGDGGPYSLDLFEAPWLSVGGKTSHDNVKPASWEIIG